MGFHFEELDETTRGFMIQEFRSEEEGGNPYRGALLTPLGDQEWPGLMEAAIREGDDDSLTASLWRSEYWEMYDRRGRPQNFEHRVGGLSTAEFNTWYVRGLSARLLSEGVDECQIYRAGPAMEPDSECTRWENHLVPVQDVYDGHRARYWPEGIGNRHAFSIPTQSGCHHSIRRAPVAATTPTDTQ